MPVVDVSGTRIYYEFSGEPENPIILQFGGSLLGRQNFHAVNDLFCKNFRLLSYDASGYGRSDQPVETYSVEYWADEAARLLEVLGLPRVLVHGTSMGGMIAIAFTSKYPEKTIAACADCAFARPDTCRRVMIRFWRRAAESMPLDDLADLITIQSVSPEFIETHPTIFDEVRKIIAKNSPYTVRQALLAVETVDLEPLARRIRRPILFTNGARDVCTPPVLTESGFSAQQVGEAVPNHVRLHEFAKIGHADLLECPEDAVQVVTAFFQEALSNDGHDGSGGTVNR